MLYENIYASILSMFASPEWKALNIEAVPQNFLRRGSSKEFVRVSPLISPYGTNRHSRNGSLIIDIFVAANNGPNRAAQLADVLYGMFEGKTIKQKSPGTGIVQFLDCGLTYVGPDGEDPSLARSTFSVNFFYNGVM